MLILQLIKEYRWSSQINSRHQKPNKISSMWLLVYKFLLNYSSLGNHSKLAYQMAKNAASNTESPPSFNLKTKMQLLQKVETEVQKNNTIQQMEHRLNCFSHSVKQRMAINVTMPHNLKATVTDHSKIWSYLYYFNISDDPTYAYKSGGQTVHHLSCEYNDLHKESSL